MKTFFLRPLFLVYLSLSLFMGCAIAHKRGSDAQVTVDYYIENRGDMPKELTRMIQMAEVKEGEVTVQWTVDQRGDTRNVSILNDTLRHEGVNTLITEHLKSMKFPKNPRLTTTTVEYTYKFQKSRLD